MIKTLCRSATILCLLAALAPAPAQERPWTVMVYGAVDNDAESHFLPFCELFAQTDPALGMEFVLLIDRAEGHSSAMQPFGEDFADTRLYRLGGGAAERLDGGEQFPELGPGRSSELDTASPETLARFIDFCHEHYPAQRTALLFYGHANGQGMLPDDQAGGDMHVAAPWRVLEARHSVDLVIFDLCAMGGIEIAYQWRPAPDRFGADWMVAIPSTGDALCWDLILPELLQSKAQVAELDPRGFGTVVVEQTEKGRWREWHRLREENAPFTPEKGRQLAASGLAWESGALYDLDRVGAVRSAVDRLADTLAHSDSREFVEELRGPRFEPGLLNYVRDAEKRWRGRPYFDLQGLASAIAADLSFEPDVLDAAETLEDRVDDLVVRSFGMPTLEGFVPDRSGVFIVMPGVANDREERSPRGATLGESFSWYRPMRREESGFDFLSGTSEAVGRVGWFDLLDRWYGLQRH